MRTRKTLLTNCFRLGKIGADSGSSDSDARRRRQRTLPQKKTTSSCSTPRRYQQWLQQQAYRSDAQGFRIRCCCSPSQPTRTRPVVCVGGIWFGLFEIMMYCMYGCCFVCSVSHNINYAFYKIYIYGSWIRQMLKLKINYAQVYPRIDLLAQA